MRAACSTQVLCADPMHPELSSAQTHHLMHVLRLREGAKVAVVDGRGSWTTAILRGEKLYPECDLFFEERDAERAIAFSLPKGDKAQLVVQKLTEIGISRIMPITTRFTVVRWDDAKMQARIERLRVISAEATMQSRQTWLSRIDDLTPFSALESAERVLAHWGGEPIAVGDTCIAIGPEGGWSEEELASASRLVDLGPSVLRSETAAIAAAILLRAAAHHEKNCHR